MTWLVDWLGGERVSQLLITDLEYFVSKKSITSHKRGGQINTSTRNSINYRTYPTYSRYSIVHIVPGISRFPLPVPEGGVLRYRPRRTVVLSRFLFVVTTVVCVLNITRVAPPAEPVPIGGESTIDPRARPQVETREIKQR